MKKSILIVGVVIVVIANLFAQTENVSFALPLSEYRVTQGFGENINVVDFEPFFHPGIDLYARLRSPVYASLSGTITEVGSDRAYGNFIRILHISGYETFYGQLDSIAVTQGQSVAQGDVIGRLGNTGLSTGPHLHFGIYRNGDPINPRSVLRFL